MSDESSYEFLDENDAYNQNEYYEYDLKYDPENKNENPEYWDRKKRIKWNVMLFFGCMLLYSTRTSLSICVSRMSKDYGWDKRISVSCEIVVSRIQTLKHLSLFFYQSPEVFCKKEGVLKIFAKFRLWHRCFSVNLANILRTPFL